MNWNFLKKLFSRNTLHLEAFGRTDTGKKRPNNEDSFAVLQQHNLFIVADGMGGHKAGEVASQNAVNILAEYLIEADIVNSATNQAAVRHSLVSGFSHTNDAIMEMSRTNESYSGMGCTMIACYINKDQLHLCHVGDVRGYCIQQGSIKQLTHDHSYAAEYEDTQPESSNKLPPKNIVTQAIGFPFKEGPEYNTFSFHSGDRAMICTDGLWGMLDDSIIQEIIHCSNSPELAGDTLIDRANEAGGKDNITTVTIFHT